MTKKIHLEIKPNGELEMVDQVEGEQLDAVTEISVNGQTFKPESDFTIVKKFQFETIRAKSNRGRLEVKPAYSGGLMRVADSRWVVVDLEGLQIEPETEIRVNHDPDLVIGSGLARIDNNELEMTGQVYDSKYIDDNADDDLQASIGATIVEAEKLEAGTEISVNGQKFKPTVDFLLVKKSFLHEVSIVQRGADQSTRAQLAASIYESRKMPVTENTTTTPEVHEADLDALQAMLSSDEARSLTPDDMREIKTSIIAGTMTEDALKKRIKLSEMLEDLTLKGGAYVPPQQRRESGGNHVDILTASLLMKGGHGRIAAQHFGDRILSAAEPLSKKTLIELSAEALRMEGKRAPHGKSEILQASVGISTMSLPVALGNAMHKAVLSLLGDFPDTWSSFSAQRSAMDFHIHNELRPHIIGDLDELPQDGQFKHGTLVEEPFQWQVNTFGKILTVTRKDWIQDSADFLQSIPTALARMFGKKTSAMVWTTILENAGGHFSNGNNNLMPPASALSVDNLAEAVRMMKVQKDKNGEDCDIQASVLVVPPSLESTARSILQSLELRANVAEDEKYGTANPVAGIVDLEVEPRIENAKYPNSNPATWYVFSKPSDVPFIVGNGPSAGQIDFLDLNSDVNTLSLGWRAYFDRGVAFGEPRAAVLSEGA